MNQDMKKELDFFPNVKAMMEGIPEQLWDIFLPETTDELAQMETNAAAFKQRAVEREQVIAMQQLCGMPLRPNAELREVRIKAKIQGLRHERIRQRRNTDRHDPI